MVLTAEQRDSAHLSEISQELPRLILPTESLFEDRDLAHYLGNVGASGSPEIREHSTTTMLRMRPEGSDYTLGVRVTEPIEKLRQPLTIVAFPAFGEIAQDGVGATFHDDLAEQLPTVRIMTIETDGMGQVGDRLSGRQRKEHGLRVMAQERLRLLSMLPPEEAIIIVGTSMGTVIAVHAMDINTKAEKPMNIVGGVFVAPAIVREGRTIVDMGVRFTPTMVLDGLAEIFWRHDVIRKPLKFIDNLAPLTHTTFRNYDPKIMASHGMGLMDGVPMPVIKNAVDNYEIVVISGSHDSVGEHPMWYQLETEQPHLKFVPLKHRGHGIAIKPHDAASKTARTILAMGVVNGLQLHPNN